MTKMTMADASLVTDTLNESNRKPLMVMFGEDWQSLPSSSQHLAKALAARFNIVWINSIGLRQPSWRQLGRDLPRLMKKLCTRTSAATASDDQAQPQRVVAPKVWPLAQVSWLQRLNRWLLQRQLGSLAEVEFVYCALPSAVDYLPLFPNAKVIYYCGDDFSALAGVDHHRVDKLEQRLLKQSDWVFCASETLQRRCGWFSQRPPQLLPHGVELSRFSTPQSRPEPLPDKPLLGFYGSLAQWIDFDLLSYLADRFYDCQLVLIGHRGLAPQALLARPNVSLLPFMAHQQLPQFVQHFDVGLLPFVANRQIAACDPLKLREYLAAGVPVVSRPIAALDQYRYGVQQCGSPQAFGDAVAAALKHAPKPERIRQQVAEAGWSQRAQQLIEQLQIANEHS